MIEIACKKNKFTYNVYHITKAFFPSEEITQKVDEKQESLVELKLPGGSCFSLAPEEIRGELPGLAGAEAAEDRSGSGEKADARSDSGEKAADAVPFAGTEAELAHAEKRAVTRRVYRFLCAASGSVLAWGTLAGVRPTKLARRTLAGGSGRGEITGLCRG